MVHGARFTKHCMHNNVIKYTGTVSEQELGWFQNILKNHLENQECKKQVNLAISDNIRATQKEVSQQLVQKKLKHSTTDSVSNRQLSIKSCIDQMSLPCVWIRFRAKTTRNFYLPVKGA